MLEASILFPLLHVHRINSVRIRSDVGKSAPARFRSDRSVCQIASLSRDIFPRMPADSFLNQIPAQIALWDPRNRPLVLEFGYIKRASEQAIATTHELALVPDQRAAGGFMHGPCRTGRGCLHSRSAPLRADLVTPRVSPRRSAPPQCGRRRCTRRGSRIPDSDN